MSRTTYLVLIFLLHFCSVFCLINPQGFLRVEATGSGEEFSPYKSITMPTETACLMICHQDEQCNGVQVKPTLGGATCGFLGDVETVTTSRGKYDVWLTCRTKSGEDLAYKKPAFQTDNHSGSAAYVAAKAVDHNANTYQCTNSVPNPYWYVDLERHYNIDKLVMRGFGAVHSSHLTIAFFSKDPKSISFDLGQARYSKSLPNGVTDMTLEVKGWYGRYLLFKRGIQGHFCMYDIKVYGKCEL